MVSKVTDIMERKYFSRGLVVAGLDEVGRGAWAGPVTVGAVVYAPDIHIQHLNDSKCLSPSRRLIVYESICTSKLSWSVGSATPREVDKYGLTAALCLASRRALSSLAVSFDMVLLDGNYDYVNHDICDKKYLDKECLSKRYLDVVTCIKGDSLGFSMAAASVVAKVSRDRHIASHKQAEMYGWSSNKGYATAEHIRRVDAQGLSALHRRSFAVARK